MCQRASGPVSKWPILCQTASGPVFKWPILCQTVSGPDSVQVANAMSDSVQMAHAVSDNVQMETVSKRQKDQAPLPHAPALCYDVTGRLLARAMQARGRGRRGEDGGSRCPNNRLKWNPQAILDRGVKRARKRCHDSLCFRPSDTVMKRMS